VLICNGGSQEYFINTVLNKAAIDRYSLLDENHALADLMMPARRQGLALPASEAEAGSESTPGLRRVLESAAEAPEKMPSAAGLPKPAEELPGSVIENIPSSSTTAAAIGDDRSVSVKSTKCALMSYQAHAAG
jgi:hypothetical protein